MNKRESIIILLAALLAAYGLLDYFVLSKKKTGTNEEIIKAAITEAETAGTAATASLTALIAKNRGRELSYTKSKVESPWLKDPFIHYDKGSEHLDASEDAVVPDMTYSGFIQLGSHLLGIINGMEYRIGDLVLELGYKVIQITPLKATLLTQTNKQVTLYLQED